MTKKTSLTYFFPLLRATLTTLATHPVIFFPLCITTFLQLFSLEILYFAPRFPLVVFFGPLIRRIWGEIYLHYPFNFILLPKLLYFAQIPIYIFAGGFLSAIAISLIASINQGKRATFKTALKKVRSSYVHIVLASLTAFTTFLFVSRLYGLVIQRAMHIRSETGIFYTIKMLVIQGAPYVNLVLGVFVTTIFVFVIPIIVIEKKKFIAALLMNFKTWWKSFLLLCIIIGIPTMMYIPILLLRSNISMISEKTTPGIQLIVMVLSIIVTLLIDAIVLTATTMYYLAKKEQR